MVSLHIETARFKSPGHKNELCFFWDTLLNIHDYLDLYDKIHEFPNCGNLRVQSTVTLDLHGLNGHHDL